MIVGIKAPKSVSIIGCGGTGTWTGIFLSMMGVKKMNLFDGDTIEASNLARLPYSKSSLNRNKAEILKEFIENIRDDMLVFAFPHMDEISIGILNEKDSIVFDCTDNAEVQRKVHGYCRENKIPYQGVHYDGLQVSISDKPAGWGKGGGYEVTPSWVIPAVLSSLVAVYNQTYSKPYLKKSMTFKSASFNEILNVK